MLLYEKNNKLNISFDNEIKENPDLQIGKSGDKTEILVDGGSNSGLPEYDDTMSGAVLTLVAQPRVLIEAQTVTIDTENGYGQFTHGFDTTGFVDGKTEALCTMDGTACAFVWQSSSNIFVYNAKPNSWSIYPNGKIGYTKRFHGNVVFSDITTTAGGELVPQWVGGNNSSVINNLITH